MSDRHLILKIISILFLFSILQEFNYCCYAFSFNTVIIIGSGTRSRTVHQDGISLMPRSLSSSSSSSSELFMTSSASTSVPAPVSVSVSVSVTEEDSEEEIERKRKLKQKFETLRRGFPKNANIVNAGGWYNLEQLSHDPKSTLTQFILDGIKKEAVTLQHHHNQESKSSSEEKEKHHDHEGIEKENQERDNEKLNALCLLLYGMGKGFIADTMDGEWDIVFTKSSTKSTSGGTSTTPTTTTSSSRNTVVIGGGDNNNNKSKNNRGNRLFFNIQQLIFQKRYTFLKWGLLINTIKYLPISENYSISSKGKIVVRRIVCTLLNRILKWWKLPSIKLPTIRSIKKRYLDIIYLDNDICISGSGFGSGFGGDISESGRQNQNQLFIHFRPKYLQTMMSQYNRFTATTTTLSGSGIGHSNSNSNNYGDILDDSLC